MSDSENTVAIFEGYKIRQHYDEEKEVWYFSVINIIAVLTDQKDYKRAKSYWTTLKNRIRKEGSQPVKYCDRLKFKALDWKMRFTDVINPETLLRFMQSVPSPKVEPIKLWLTKVGYERMKNMADPARSIDREQAILAVAFNSVWPGRKPVIN